MINIINTQTLDGKKHDPIELPSAENETIDALGAYVLPGAIDPHVHFRIPGQAYKEDWMSAAQATINGGYTRVFDMPNNLPACVSVKRFQDKQAEIDKQLKQVSLPLRYDLYLGADRNHFDQIHLMKDNVVAIKVFMGSSTGDLLMDDDSSLHAVFSLAAHHNMLVAVHAEEECMIQDRIKQFADCHEFSCHSKIRTPAVAAAAVEKAIFLAELYGTRLYILHVSSIDELELIKKAKARGLNVFAEASPHHLFLNTNDYPALGAKAQMNPPLREPKHQAALLAAIHDGTIDTLGSDHAPHTLDEKGQPYGKAPSGVPGIETNLPLLLDAVNRGDLSLQHVKALTHDNVLKVFHQLPDHREDKTIVNLSVTKTVNDEDLATKCGWSPFSGRSLTGWPSLTIIGSQCFKLAI